ncbi:bifunctional glycosyltransferase family 2/GtrA family protein [Patulibacter sp.]|uniref:bifunctional glycosyltransferase family 2/GtrA family protein n=1 Tax=Patulibacter sp. TaxID=1912859 RepID=UPI00271E1173|nr:bifunctional glycosyltransferase family 2/GtrA family protein [Patulibacter sp.]MDO9407312.1 bifunctional glycosyltransferase family 2/GtrA family protein [Patulibacter sp.]
MSSSTLPAVRRDGLVTAPAPVVEIVVPVYNEAAALPGSIRRLHEHLAAAFPFAWRVVVANNASTDATAAVARALADDLPGVELLDLAEKGRGRALRAAWSSSDADVLCYMDVDLSTDLNALLPLVAPLISGHSDLAIGTRLARSSNVVRGPRRELISRTYNRILRMSLQARFSDAQCGFKAIRRDAAERLLPQVQDQAWFFDTELLVLAQRDGLRIHEVPVDWTDDPDSSVDIVRTATDDLKGVARLLATGWAGSMVGRFLAIGVVSTLAYALLFLLMRGMGVGPGPSNVLGLALTAVANTQANRRWSFRVTGREHLVRHHAQGAAVFVLTVLLTSGALAALNAIDPDPGHAIELVVLVAASVLATVSRYVALRFWVFGRPAPQDAATPVVGVPATRASLAERTGR